MIVEGGKKYNVKLIPQTCTREDAIREIVNALDHLNAVSDEIFSTIRTRIGSHQSQVKALTSRVSAASEQISGLKGSQKAIRIISPAKYPCETPNPSADTIVSQMTFPSLVAKYVPELPLLGHDTEEDEEMRCQRPLRFDSSIKHPNDLLSIFHVKEPKLGDLNQLDNVADVGLGKPPHTIRNMDSFFLFNTIDNPYTNYKMTERSQQDRNFGTLKPTRKGEEVQADVCPIVPSESDAGGELKKDLDDFYYYPSAVEIPNIDVPDSLPDLPGIADTFDLPEEPLSSLFPSKPFTLSPLPPQASSTPRKPAEMKTDEDFSTRDKSDSFDSNSSSQQQHPHSSTSSSVNSAETQKPSPPSAAIPPPPPPPPQMTATKVEAKPASSLQSSGGGSGDLRSSLMAAIREAGGSGNARLKSAKDRKYEAKKKKQDEKEKIITTELEEGGDLMSDLKNTLAMRRRGISGLQGGQKGASGVGEIMLSLAATIPTMDSSIEAPGAGGGSDEDDWD